MLRRNTSFIVIVVVRVLCDEKPTRGWARDKGRAPGVGPGHLQVGAVAVARSCAS